MFWDMQLVAQEPTNLTPLLECIVATLGSVIGWLRNDKYAADGLHFAGIKQLTKLILAI